MNISNCPFCSREDPKILELKDIDEDDFWVVQCPRCLAMGPMTYVSESNAVWVWNERTKVDHER